MPVLLVVSVITHTKFDIFHSMLMSKLVDSWCQISQMVPATIFCWFDLFLSDIDVLFSYCEKKIALSRWHIAKL